MGAAKHAEPVTSDVERILERTLAASDRTRSSVAWGAASALVLTVLWHLPAQQGQLALRTSLLLWFAAWAAWAVASRAGAPSRRVLALEIASELVSAAGTAIAIYAIDPLNPVVWLVIFARSLAWPPRRQSVVAARRWGSLAGSALVAGALVHQGNVSSAVLVLALMAGHAVALQVGTQLVNQRLELEAEGEVLSAELERLAVRDETDRIARELHDGLGAELVALLLALRERTDDVRGHAEQVLTLLEQLRSVVWTVRGGRGSVAEFEKLLRARARLTLAAIPVLESRGSTRSGRFVEPDVSLAILATLHAVLRRAVTLPGLSAVDLAVDAAPLAVKLQLRGVSDEAVAALAADAERGLELERCPVVSTGADGTLTIAVV